MTYVVCYKSMDLFTEIRVIPVQIAVSRASLIFQKDFQMLLVVKEGEIQCITSISCTMSNMVTVTANQRKLISKFEKMTTKTILSCSNCNCSHYENTPI